MQSTPDPPRPPCGHESSPAAGRAGPVRARLVRAADTILPAVPPWTLLATIMVVLSALLGNSPALPWIGLALAGLPLLLQTAARGPASLRTPFDIPMALLLAGALTGYLTSPDRTISLGALQLMLAFTLCYYSWANYPRRASLATWVMALVPPAFLVVLLLFLLDLRPSGQPNFMIGGAGTHHGLAMYLSMTGAFCLGVAAFARNLKVRFPAAAFSVFFLAVALIITWDSIWSLFFGDTASGRLDLWRPTADLLGDSWFSGLGLGCWNLAMWGTADLSSPVVEHTHVHNAYLELYANTGLPGLLALIIALGIGVRLSRDIIRSPREHPWYGFGIGVILAAVVALLVGALESAPMGVPLVAPDTYRYFISPAAWFSCGALAVARHLLARDKTG